MSYYHHQMAKMFKTAKNILHIGVQLFVIEPQKLYCTIAIQ